MKQIGKLNRNYGYSGYELIPKGTKVFEDNGKYFFEMKLISSGEKHRQTFDKRTLAPHIDFIADSANVLLQQLDANCNDCKHMVRDFEAYNKHNALYNDTAPHYRIQYGKCNKLKKAVTFIPNVCQLDTQDCFEHRRL